MAETLASSSSAVVDKLDELAGTLAVAMRQYLDADVPPPHGMVIGEALSKARVLVEVMRRDLRFRARVRPRN
ncbi:MAG: hypothetical protein JO061_03620 [Acidobacteriaceae bacterium]|nr:hypothetical protein [Acidobacteriaceae bacterium]